MNKFGKQLRSKAKKYKIRLTVKRRGIIKRTILQVNDINDTLGVGLTHTVERSPFGLGLITVTVNVTAADIDPIEITTKGFIFLRFIRLR